jgi:hypothetical protein
MKFYDDKEKAQRACAMRSRNAASKGQPSQFALVAVNGRFAGGPAGVVLKWFVDSPLIGQLKMIPNVHQT